MSQVTAFVTPQKQDSRDGSIGDDGASEEAAADEDNGGKKQPARAPSKEDGPPVWIKKDVKLLATMSRKSFPSKAICLSDPVKGEDNEWFIDVEWLESCSNWRDRVKCVHCLQISSDAHPKRSRKVRDLSEKSLAESPLPKKKQPRHSRSKPNDQPPTNYTNNAEEDDRKSAARETNQRVIQAAREKTIRSVDMLHKKYSNGMIHKALDKVGFPFGIQDTAGELRELARQKKLKEDAEKIHDGRQPFKVRKGTTIRKSWQDGIGYDGIVKDANPKKKLLDGEKEMVDVWRVEYDTGVFEDMTKAEIRQWRFPRPELPLCLGRKFNFLEVFSGK